MRKADEALRLEPLNLSNYIQKLTSAGNYVSLTLILLSSYTLYQCAL